MAKIITLLLTVLLLQWESAVAQTKEPPPPAPNKPTAAEDRPKEAKDQKVKAALITVEGMIDGGLHSSLQRRIDKAREAGSSILFFEIDTYGGALDAAFSICDLLTGISDMRTVAYVPNKAISAGALIAVACNEIDMGPHSLLGDCEPIIPSAEKGMITAPEKTQTVLRARFRSLAEKNGYPSLLAQAMVTKEMEVYQVTIGDTKKFLTKYELDNMTEQEKLRFKKNPDRIVSEDELLTMTSSQALDYGFAKRLVASRQELFQSHGVSEANVAILPTNWSEEMVRFLSFISPLLLVIGLMALYMELKMPGFGLPGTVAILCFGTVFLSKYLIGLAEHWEVLIFVFGAVLLAVEIFLIPGFGITGILGLIFMGVAIILSFQPSVVPVTPFEVQMAKVNLLKVLGSVTASIVGMCILARYLPDTPVFHRIVLSKTQKVEDGYVVGSAAQQGLVGREGIAITKLRPVGRAQIGEEVLSVVTQGELIEKDAKVKVIEVKGNRIVVRET